MEPNEETGAAQAAALPTDPPNPNDPGSPLGGQGAQIPAVKHAPPVDKVADKFKVACGNIVGVSVTLEDIETALSFNNDQRFLLSLVAVAKLRATEESVPTGGTGAPSAAVEQGVNEQNTVNIELIPEPEPESAAEQAVYDAFNEYATRGYKTPWASILALTNSQTVTFGPFSTQRTGLDPVALGQPQPDALDGETE